MGKTIFYFAENNKNEIFLKHPWLERHKTFAPAGSAPIGDSGIMVKIFNVPHYRKKAATWDKAALLRVLQATLDQYGKGEWQILLGASLRSVLKEAFFQNQAAAALEMGRLLVQGLTGETVGGLSLVLPGNNFFLLEEELFWIRDVFGDGFGKMKEMSIYVMNSEGIPPIVHEFTDYLELEYGLLPDVWNMNTCSARELLHAGGLSPGGLPQVILDLDGSDGLPDILCPSGSKYIDLFSSGKTESRLAGENAEIRYISPLSILDTATKNGYNIVVNQRI